MIHKLGSIPSNKEKSVFQPVSNIFKNICIYFWLPWVFIAACRLSLAAMGRAYSLVAMHGLLIAVASLVVEHGL